MVGLRGNLMKKINKASKAASVYVFSNFFAQGISVIAIAIFTRIMSPSDYGIYNTYISWIPILSLVIGLSTGSVLRVVYFEKWEERNSYVSALIGLGGVISCIYLGIALLFFTVGKNYNMMFFAVMAIINAFAYFICDLASKVFMLENMYIHGAGMQCVLALLPAFLAIIFIISCKYTAYKQRIWGNVLGYLIVALFFIFFTLKKCKTIYNISLWKEAIKYSAPLIIQGIANNLLAQSDRSMITYYISSVDTGIYSVAYSLSVIVLGTTSAIENVWIPWFTDKMKDNDYDAINEVAQKYIWFGSILVCIAMLCMPEVLVCFAGEKYKAGVNYIVPLILSSYFVFLYSIIVDLEYLLRATKIIAANTLIAGFMNVFLNFLFIPQFGAQAAAYTTLVSYIISFLIHYLYASRIKGEVFGKKMFLRPIIIVALVGIGVNGLLSMAYIRWIIAIVLVIVILFIGKRIMKSYKLKRSKS